MSEQNQEMQLNPCGWFLEQEKKTEQLLNHMRHTRGTFHTEKDVSYAFYEGYLAGLKSMYRKFEEMPIEKRK